MNDFLIIGDWSISYHSVYKWTETNNIIFINNPEKGEFGFPILKNRQIDWDYYVKSYYEKIPLKVRQIAEKYVKLNSYI